jgi:hypothetical protein
MWTSTLASKGFPAYGDQLLLCAMHNTLMNHTFNFIFLKGKKKIKILQHLWLQIMEHANNEALVAVKCSWKIVQINMSWFRASSMLFGALGKTSKRSLIF